jgi:hypothetical protein
MVYVMRRKQLKQSRQNEKDSKLICGSWEGPLCASERAGGADALISSFGEVRKVTGGGVPSAPPSGYNALLSSARFRSRTRIRILVRTHHVPQYYWASCGHSQVCTCVPCE